MAAWRTLGVNRQGHITERYTRGIDQLGRDALDAQLGGIYGLDRIVRDSPDDRLTILEVLTASAVPALTSAAITSPV